MARENQGLQIALIIFVMLTILLGVMTFLFFRQYQEANIKAVANAAEAEKQRQVATTVQDENNQLKEMIGLAATDKLDTITTEYNKDMETYGANYDQANRNYRKILAYLFDVVQKKNAALAAEQDQVKKLTESLATFETVKQPQIDTHAAAAQKAGQDVIAMRDQFTKDLADVRSKEAGMLKTITAKTKELEETKEKAEAEKKQKDTEITSLGNLYGETRRKLEKVISPTFEKADGEIRWVNQRQRTVWINLGRLDGLQRQISFSVYSADLSDMTQAGRKGTIEVVQILGDHLAEARIVDDNISDPILPGDVIHTPVWAPGHRERFALAGIMDIDKDGDSDLETVRNLISMNGGVIDAAQDGDKIEGKITTDTGYLVVGTPPGSDAPKDVMDRYQQLLTDARKIGIKEITLEELLRRMGWVDENQVVNYGKGATAADFRTRQSKDTVPRVSDGNVTDLFKQRNPPRATRGSAY